MVRWLLYTLGLCLLCAAFALPAAAHRGPAQVRVIHASPDAPAVDVFVDGQAVLTGVAFPAVSAYLNVPAGEHTIVVAPAGAGLDAAVITAEVRVKAGKAYSIAAVGLLATDSLTAQVYADNLAAPAAGQAHVRVIHASPDAPAVDVNVVDGPTLLAGLAFPTASDYLAVEAGTYDLQVTPAGADDVVIDLADTHFQPGRIYDVIAVGTLDTIQAVVASVTPDAARLPDTGGGT